MRAALAHYVRRSAAQRARGSAATDSPSASAASCATESCTATERRCATNVSHVRADHVVSSYSDEASLLLRHSAAARLADVRLARHGLADVRLDERIY